jgi:hypothetical protein
MFTTVREWRPLDHLKHFQLTWQQIFWFVNKRGKISNFSNMAFIFCHTLNLRTRYQRHQALGGVSNPQPLCFYFIKFKAAAVFRPLSVPTDPHNLMFRNAYNHHLHYYSPMSSVSKYVATFVFKLKKY